MVVFILAAVAAIAAYAYFSKPQIPKATASPGVVSIPAPAVSGTKTRPLANPDEDPTPIPDTEPATDPEEMPDATASGEESRPVPKTFPTAPKDAAPKFDVTGFFERVRKIMQDRAKPAINVHRSDLKVNLAGFERALKRQLRNEKMSNNETDRTIEKAIAGWTADGGRIPENIGEKLDAIPDVTTVYDESVQKQTGFDDTLQQELSKQSLIYISGLEKQIERLKPDHDVGAIKLIEAEILQIKKFPKYFSDLMLSAP